MRKLDRTKITVPDILTDATAAGVLERNDAIAFFSRKIIPPGEKFTYSVYSSAVVKKAVSDLSYDKCAYCESPVLAIDDGDVEHFRPKGEVTLENKTSLKPGYYWLGADWDNLFLSCKHCNQARKQETQDGMRRTLGKKNQFPLSDNKKRVRSHKKDIKGEEPYRLLIDPAKENPLDFIEFDEAGFINPKKRADQSEDPKGKASIEVFALLRKKLKEAREMHALTLMAALKTYEDLAKNLEANASRLPQDYLMERKEMLKEQIEKLKVYTQEGQVFSAMSLCIITAFLKKRGVDFKG
ncbi:MAG TPA: hypothetical protein VEY06_01470 [Flavisolibacter sp.]|nr:hypothetical protein [Flavisolibacter sp.]